MAVGVGFSGWGFLEGERLATASFIVAHASESLGPSFLKPLGLAATCLKNRELRSRVKTRALWLEKWSTISLEEIILPKEVHQQVNLFNTVGPTKGLLTTVTPRALL